jgi:hypothetical protein
MLAGPGLLGVGAKVLSKIRPLAEVHIAEYAQTLTAEITTRTTLQRTRFSVLLLGADLERDLDF